MEIDIKEGTDFYTELHKRIDFFNRHTVMDSIARSVVTGNALDEINVEYVDENIHQGRSFVQALKTKNTPPPHETNPEKVQQIFMLSKNK
jgi:hypothetical protein